ncbi:MAG: hypothetical protein LBM56_02605 [Burkholderiaceae bacterium]|jgi:hypothetical protein|nr:hypothetical protein [Burkholderiaceae bacterium]
MAWVYPAENQDEALPAMQAKARKARIGLWKDAVATPPWEYRRPGLMGHSGGGARATGPAKALPPAGH